MKVELLKNYFCPSLPVGVTLEVVPGMEVDSESIFNTPSGMCYLCRTVSGDHFYVPAIHLKVVDTDTTDWDQVRVQAAIQSLNGILSDSRIDICMDSFIELAIEYSDRLIEKLKVNDKRD